MAQKLPDVLTRMTKAQAEVHAQRASQKVVYHMLCLLYFSNIIYWHFTPPAERLPGAAGFGWFFKYFTFCSFTAQTIQFLVCALDDVTWQAEKPPLRRVADIISCSMFCMANTVTFMFYTMNFITGGKAEEPCIHRPNWLSPSVHIYNAAAAWGDFFISDTRTFSKTSLLVCLVMSVAYGSWLKFVAGINRKYPYPFLNHVRQPHGFVATFVVSTLCMVVWYIIGRLSRGPLLKLWGKGLGWWDKKMGGSQAATAETEKKGR